MVFTRRQVEAILMELKNDGDILYGREDYLGAVEKYSDALDIILPGSHNEMILLKKRASAYLHLKEYEKVIEDTTKVLVSSPHDVKSLFKRCQALEKVRNYDEAFMDAAVINELDPHYSSIQSMLEKLDGKLQEIEKKRQKASKQKVKRQEERVQGKCPVCWKAVHELHEEKVEVLNLPCKHEICKPCVQGCILNERTYCPVCRTIFTRAFIRRAYRLEK